jgi:formylglycine-generating enzyme required for sulfatase activity
VRREQANGLSAIGRAWKEESGGQCGERVIRGGSWLDEPVALRSSGWEKAIVDFRSGAIGFRLAQDLK